MPSFCPYPTQTRNSGRAKPCLVVQRQWRWNRGVPGTGVAPVGKRDPPELPEFFGERRFSGGDVCGPALVLPRGRQ
jgi:hypothetical protein